jgi:hypothetical protein
MLTNRFSTRTIVLLVTAIALIALLTLKAYLGHGRAGMVDFHAASVGDAIHLDTHSPLPPGKQMALDNVATGVTDPQVLRDLAKVRRATAKYHNVNTAIADGYVPTTACDAVPGVGGMGYHYVNPALAMDPAVDVLTPEILMYAASGKDLRLVGVEYFQGIGAPDALVPDPAPPAAVLFGLPFDGPMLGHIPGMPPHYDLHVWIWQPNPDGMFAMWNPNVTCP